MLMRISVIQFRGSTPAAKQAYIFDERGGSIGREEGNQLILQDESRVLSRVQAQISFADGQFHLLDHGGNPSLVNGLRVGKGNRRPLYDGDILELGEYKLRAKLIGGGEDPREAPQQDSDADLDISLNVDIDFDELSTIVPPTHLAQAAEAAEDIAARQTRPSAPQLVAALSRGLALGKLSLPAALDAECMEALGQHLHRALKDLAAHPEPAGRAALLQTLFTTLSAQASPPSPSDNQ